MLLLEPDTLALMKKRVYDIAGCNPGKKVSIYKKNYLKNTDNS